jgi:hypothetical protein
MWSLIEVKNMTRILFSALVIIVSMAAELQAADLTWTTSAKVTSSDNIYRDGPGQEENGTLLTQGITGKVTQRWGRRTFSLLAGGGWETIQGNEVTSDENYRLELNASFPWSATGRLEASAQTSQQTATPDPGDQDQLRSLVNQSEIRLLVGNRISAVSQWQADVRRTKERSINVDDLQNSVSLQYSSRLSQTRSFSFQGNVDDGRDDESEFSWKGSSASITLSNNVERDITRSYDITWEEIVITDQDGVENSSDKLGLRVRFLIEKASGWSYETRLGLDSVQTESEDRIWDPAVGAVAKGPISRVVRAESEFEITTRIQDSRNIGEDRTRRGTARAELSWNASRVMTVIPEVRYQHEEIFTQGFQERIDELFLIIIGTEWTPTRAWLFELDAIFENNDSTDPTSELDENRVELTISSTWD